MVDLDAILLAAISLSVKPFWCKAMMMARVSLQAPMVDRGRTMIPSTTFLLKPPVCYLILISMTEWSPALSSSTLTPVLTRESLTWCQLVLLWQGWNAVERFLGDSVHLHGKEGLHLITLHNILEYMQIAITQTEAADFVKLIFVSFSNLLATTVHILIPSL